MFCNKLSPCREADDIAAIATNDIKSILIDRDAPTLYNGASFGMEASRMMLDPNLSVKPQELFSPWSLSGGTLKLYASILLLVFHFACFEMDVSLVLDSMKHTCVS